MTGAAGAGSPRRSNADTVYLIDASIYVFRAWYSVPDDFSDPQGRPTNAVYGFAHFLCEVLENTQAKHIAVAFDEALESSFRNSIYPDYKANREPAPQELKDQFGWCRRMAEALGMPCYSDNQYEADDLIGSLARHAQSNRQQVAILTADKDLSQLLIDEDYLWDYARRQRLDGSAIFKRFGVYPQQIADFLALTGDSVDNIPGVPGIGPKTAATLLKHYQDLDTLWDKLDEVAFLSIRGAKGIALRLREHRAAAELARQLTGIATHAIEYEPLTRRQPGDVQLLDELCDELGFGRLLRGRCQALIDA